MRKLAPEWVVTNRLDALLDKRFVKGWSISSAPLQRGASFTDFGNSEIAVPMGQTEEEKAVRLHEMLHASLSPAEVPAELLSHLGLDSQAVRLAEEVRINLAGRFINRNNEDEKIIGDIALLRDGSELALSKEAVNRKAWNEALSLYLTTLNTDVHKKVRSKLRTIPEWAETFDEIDKWLNRSGYKWEHRKRPQYEAVYKARRFARDTRPVAYAWTDKTGAKQNTLLNLGFSQFTLPLSVTISSWLASPPHLKGAKEDKATPHKPKFENTLQSELWADLRIGATRLTETTNAFIGRRKRPAMTGKQPSRPDRLLTDPERRIFREVTKTLGGVVVFDCSGSMGVNHDVVRKAVKEFSGATVLVYSHTGSSRDNAWVVARNGRMISKEDFDELPLNSGNGVDGLALRWALSQRRNNRDFLVWVSDGEVTGRGDHQTPELIEECAVLVQKNGIANVSTCEEALDLLKDIKRSGRVPKNRYSHKIKIALDQMRRIRNDS